MTVKRPTDAQLDDIATGLGMTLRPEEIPQFQEGLEAFFSSYDIVDSLPDFLPDIKYPRTPGIRPLPEDNPHNAWCIKTEIKGASRGKLKGKTVAIKDNVCLAGVPMRNGSSTLEGYTPDVDATIVTRMLDAGATIVGKTQCELFCLSGGSHTSDAGHVHNPYKRGYSAGGSSSGSAVTAALGEVDMAVGGDQGGSIRMPASWCGIYGMKPTHGLVPYTGVMPIESTIDHTGPLTGSLADNALMLEVIAGEDGLDPRQYNVKTAQYTKALGKGAKGLKVGVVKEGFGHDNSEADVDEIVRAAADRLGKLGMEVEDISLPMHAIGTAIWQPIAAEGLTWQMMHGNGLGRNWKGLHVTGLLDAHKNWIHDADKLSVSLKAAMFTGEYFLKHYGGHFYAKAQNLNRRLTASYNEALSTYDVLLMPTTVMKATPLPEADAPISLYLQRAFEMVGNTAPFDATGHPALAVPCGMSDGLPVSMQLTGRHFDEATIYQIADAFASSVDWKTI